MNKEEYTSELLKRLVDSIFRHGGERLISSIILTGSFGREEPTWSIDPEGRLVLKSDVEVSVVQKKYVKSKDVRKLIMSVRDEFPEDLNLMSFNESRLRNASNFNYSICKQRHKTLFTFDLFNGSKTIWGIDYLGNHRITIDDVDPYEAKRLVANRIGEYAFLTHNNNNDIYVRKQWKGKIVLAICSACLLLNKLYVSSYHGQKEVFLAHPELALKLGDNFIQDYNSTFSFLRDGGESFEVDDTNLREYVENINKEFKGVQLETPRVNNLMRLIKDSIKYLKTGCKYGITGFENKILSSLLDAFERGDKDSLNKTALVWHNCIY